MLHVRLNHGLLREERVKGHPQEAREAVPFLLPLMEFRFEIGGDPLRQPALKRGNLRMGSGHELDPAYLG